MLKTESTRMPETSDHHSHTTVHRNSAIFKLVQAFDHIFKIS